MQVRILSTHKGSPDGVQVQVYPAGEVVDMPSRLANIFVREGWAETYIEPPPTREMLPEPPEHAAILEAPAMPEAPAVPRPQRRSRSSRQGGHR
jgi:hypothetical protein